jgi:hypothetical protein
VGRGHGHATVMSCSRADHDLAPSRSLSQRVVPCSAFGRLSFIVDLSLASLACIPGFEHPHHQPGPRAGRSGQWQSSDGRSSPVLSLPMTQDYSLSSRLWILLFRRSRHCLHCSLHLKHTMLHCLSRVWFQFQLQALRPLSPEPEPREEAANRW